MTAFSQSRSLVHRNAFVAAALLRRSAIKRDEILDQGLWAFVVDEPGVLPEDAGTGSPW